MLLVRLSRPIKLVTAMVPDWVVAESANGVEGFWLWGKTSFNVTVSVLALGVTLTLTQLAAGQDALFPFWATTLMRANSALASLLLFACTLRVQVSVAWLA